MNFVELMQTLIQRPGYLGVLEDRRIIRLGPAGAILDATKPAYRYCYLRASDVMAVTWEAWTPQQLQAMVDQANQG